MIIKRPYLLIASALSGLWFALLLLSVGYAYVTDNGIFYLGALMTFAIASLFVFPASIILAVISLRKQEGMVQGSVAIALISSLILILILTLGGVFLTGDFGLFR